jgi:MFS superfamily sulfate permease-like transporter
MSLPKVRFDRNEIAGSFGDLSTFIVFLVAATTLCHMAPGAILTWAGLFNVLTGLSFGIPMAVQPMKAIGVIAISQKLPPESIYAAGIMMGILVLLLSCSGMLKKMMALIPRCVVRGVQLGLGLIFLKTGFDLIISAKHWVGIDSYMSAIVSATIIFLLFENRRFPPALVVFSIWTGLVLASNPQIVTMSGVSFYLPEFVIPHKNVFLDAARMLVLPQLPLTVVNSLIATYVLVKDYFPDSSARVSINKIGISVGVMNIISCSLQGMPLCHGAGGLASQYRFGARTGGSVVFLGTVKILLGLFLAGCVLSFAQHFPLSVLGTMMMFGGVELATSMKDMNKYKDVFVAVVVAGLSLIVNVAFGLAAGLILAYFWKLNVPR